MPFIELGIPAQAREIAVVVKGELQGHGDVSILRVATPDEAGAGDVCFLWEKKALSKLKKNVSCVVVTKHMVSEVNADAVIVHSDPRLAFAKFLQEKTASPWLFPSLKDGEGLICIGEGTVVADDAMVYPFVYIGERSKIGRRTRIMPFCYIGSDTYIGDDCILFPGVTVYGNTRMGSRVIVHASAVIGADGFGFVRNDSGWAKIPHRGGVEIGDDVEIGAGVTIDRGTLGVTRIGNGVKVDNLVQVAHNVEIGSHTIIAAQAGISGSVKIGEDCLVGGQAGFVNNIRMGNRAGVTPKSGIHTDVPDGEVVSGYPAVTHREWLRIMAALRHLPEMRRTLQGIRRKEEKEDER